MFRTICTLMLALFCFTFISAQDDDIRNHPWQVFVERDVDGARDRLLLVDMLTGDEVEFLVDGERYSVVRRSVLFFDRPSQRVMLASPDGTLRDHPFIQLGPGNRRVDWVISDDQHMIAWTFTNAEGENQLTTITNVASIDGTDTRLVLRDGPRQDMRALPLAFGRNSLYFDMDHIEGIENFTDFDLYGGIAALDLETDTLAKLPDEEFANCLCGANIGGAFFLRLRLTADLSGFDFHAYNLLSGRDSIIPALNLPNYTTGGNVLISPDATKAIYALARVSDFGTPQQSSQTIFVLVDLETMTQEALTRPIGTFVLPVRWTEDNSAVIFTSPIQDGTWKITLDSGRLNQIARTTYLGDLQTQT